MSDAPDPKKIAEGMRRLAGLAQSIVLMLDGLFRALDEGRGWSLVRCGDGEVHLLTHLHTPWAYIENRIADEASLAWLRDHSGKALRGADWIGWHQDPYLMGAFEGIGLLPDGWTEWRKSLSEWNTAKNERAYKPITVEGVIQRWGKVPEVFSRSVYAWGNLHMGIRRAFVERVLRREALFLAGEPMQRWLDEVLRPAGLGADATVYRGPNTLATMLDADRLMCALRDSRARVALLSLGVWAPAIAGYAKSIGRVGIDWGHLPDHNLHPYEQRHWRYPLNTTTEDSPAGTAEWYRICGDGLPTGTAHLCLPDDAWARYPWQEREVA